MRIRYFAAAKAAAGVGEEVVQAASLAQALELVRGRHGARLTEVLRVCSFVVDGEPVGVRDHEQVLVGADSLVDCLPPFAGG